MTDVNYPLRKAYYLALDGIEYNSVPVPVYYQEAPPEETADYFILLQSVSNLDDPLMDIMGTSTNMTTKVCTRGEVGNAGLAADNIAGQVLTRIHPTPNFNIDLSPDNMQCVSTSLSSDIVLEYGTVGAKKTLDRILVFRHRIKQ